VSKEIWTIYDVEWTFLTPLCGQTPASPEIIKKWLEARQPKMKPADARSIDEINEEVMQSIEAGESEETKFNKLVFQRQNGHLAMRGATVRAHIKDCARVISAQLVARVQGERAFSTRVINGVYLDPSKYWLTILDQKTGKPVDGPDGEREKPVHARGPRGQQINALKCFEYINDAKLVFRLMVLGESVTENDLDKVFQYGGVHGYAGERSEDGGRYVHKIKRISPKQKRQSVS
jgi:hypothetical protein